MRIDSELRKPMIRVILADDHAGMRERSLGLIHLPEDIEETSPHF
jgi:hypothetical protein